VNTQIFGGKLKTLSLREVDGGVVEECAWKIYTTCVCMYINYIIN
jgi:hypothetical protein